MAQLCARSVSQPTSAVRKRLERSSRRALLHDPPHYRGGSSWAPQPYPLARLAASRHVDHRDGLVYTGPRAYDPANRTAMAHACHSRVTARMREDSETRSTGDGRLHAPVRPVPDRRAGARGAGESSEFAGFGEQTRPAERRAMAAAARVAAALAPTHPHPGVETAGRKLLVGTPLAMIGRAGDLIRDASPRRSRPRRRTVTVKPWRPSEPEPRRSFGASPRRLTPPMSPRYEPCVPGLHGPRDAARCQRRRQRLGCAG